MEEVAAAYGHSPAHYAVARRDHAALKRIIAALPRLAEAGTVQTEEESLAEERRAEAIAAVIDRRDVAKRETPLHVAVRIGDATATEMLMAAGANWSLQNEQGWSALQEAICARRDHIAMIIMKHYQPMAWAKWCRRLPRLIACMRRMRDFYMEIGFHFESSVIPFIGRIAPSDTYKIWKRDANLRADTTLAGFDGFKIQRSQQSFLFLGEGGRGIAPGSLLMLSHKDKEIMNAFEDAGVPPSDAEVVNEAAAMTHSNVYRPGIDVTGALLVPQSNWRRQEKTEMVGNWKAKVYDMHNVMLSFKSRRVPSQSHVKEESDYDHLLTEDEKRQMERALDLDLDLDLDDGFLVADRPADFNRKGDFYLEKKERFSFSSSSSTKNANIELSFSSSKEEKGWVWGRRSFKDEKGVPSRSSVSIERKGGSKKAEVQQGRRSLDVKRSDFMVAADDGRKWVAREPSVRSRGACPPNDTSTSSQESVYKKGLRPVLWLTPQFPLRTDELLPLLDILADKVKAVRRLRELLTTKLPAGTFPVKVAIPVVPTIKVVITFTKFEELPPSEVFCTPPSSPANLQDLIARDSHTTQEASNSWFHWIKGPPNRSMSGSASPENSSEDVEDPFAIPADYKWTTLDAKKRQVKDKKSKTKKGKRSNSVDIAENNEVEREF
ncbi:hypothetical protein SUGI_0392690 [Cryptomeria japonica]|uniref:uncharacterized protein LOC131063637 n=1 Tax=Cryptomeria japonica TaxID=3369 RepID=UPI002408BCFE|nr:uncharacterized protein LOC131063637 [Cryptomeria japonica]GLJ21352.1 hypothetical protein SUGI_0392690 [Cryptomeria japonica]